MKHLLIWLLKGYRFAGTVSSGCNAFFVRSDVAAEVTGRLDGIWAFPSSVREARDADGRLTLAGGLQRKSVIERLPLMDVEAGNATTLAAGDVYSPEWAAGLPAKFA